MSLERLVQNRFLTPLVTGVLASLIGCGSSGSKGLGEQCGGSDTECASEYVCEQQKCLGGNGASCGIDHDCSGGMNCEQGKCVAGNGTSSGADVYSGSGKDGGSTSSGTPLATQKTVSGVGITSGTTNSNGQVLFIDSGNKETVTITVKDKNTFKGVSGAGVTFIDGNGFELFQVYKKGYVPALGVYAHNSGHEITLVNEEYSALTIFDYSQNKNPKEYVILNTYVNQMKNDYLYTKCFTKEEMQTSDEWGLAGVSYILQDYTGGSVALGLLNVINLVVDKLSLAEKNGLFVKYPFQAYHFYQSVNFTGLPEFRGADIVKEICNDGLDNDCDKYIDGKDSDCKTTSNCTSHAITVCNNNNVQWKDSCGKLEEVVKQCSTSQTCENSQCVDKKPTCTPQYSKTCSNGDVYWQDSCGNLGNVAESCTSNQTCQSGTCVDNTTEPGCVSDKSCPKYNACIQGSCFEGIEVSEGNYWDFQGPSDITWEEAKSYCDGLKFGPAGSVWALPTKQQFLTLKGKWNWADHYFWTSESCNVQNKSHTAISIENTFSSQGCYPNSSKYLVKCIKI